MKLADLARSAALALLGALVACSLAFSPDDLSSRSPGGAGGAGGKPRCITAADCDDGDPCTADTCEAGACEHVELPAGSACGKGTDCTPAPKCSAAGACVPGQSDDTKCDDKNDCTLDTCGTAGCEHAPNTGAKCNDGNPCDAAGTCSPEGTCSAKTIAPINQCFTATCPGGYYESALYCDPSTFACVDCSGFCVNTITCTFACTPTVTVCCGAGSCAAACPTGYQLTSEMDGVAACGCIPGHGGLCTKT